METTANFWRSPTAKAEWKFHQPDFTLKGATMIGLMSTTVTGIESKIPGRELGWNRVDLRLTWKRGDQPEEVLISVVLPAKDQSLLELREDAMLRVERILDAIRHPDPQKHLQD